MAIGLRVVDRQPLLRPGQGLLQGQVLQVMEVTEQIQIGEHSIRPRVSGVDVDGTYQQRLCAFRIVTIYEVACLQNIVVGSPAFRRPSTGPICAYTLDPTD